MIQVKTDDNAQLLPPANDDILHRLSMAGNLNPLTTWPKDFEDALLCSKYRWYRRIQKTRFHYKSMECHSTINDLTCDGSASTLDRTKAIDPVQLFKMKDGKLLFQHPFTFCWWLIEHFDISNRCGSCDGTTTSTVTCCEEDTLHKLMRWHLTDGERVRWFSNSNAMDLEEEEGK
jgi:hypothetical protein